MSQKPLMLKDFLELDANSESDDGFRCAPRHPDAATIRSLLEVDLGGRLIRTRSKAALTRINAVINAVKLFTSSSSSGSRRTQGRFLPKSLQKKLRRSFWKQRGEVEEENPSRVRVVDIMRMRSFEDDGMDQRSICFPSPAVSSCSSSSDHGSDFLLSSCGSSDCCRQNAAAAAAAGRGGDIKAESLVRSPNPSPKGRMDVDVGVDEDYREAATGRREPKEVEREVCHSAEEKEQLSPVSVLDFPYQDQEEEEDDDQEEDTMSPSFQQTLANIERTRHQLLQKIRRFESLAELDPVDLDARFASFDELLESSDNGGEEDQAEDEEESGTGVKTTAWDLLRQVKARLQWDPQEWDIEKLLMGFFTEGLSCSGDYSSSPLQWRGWKNTSREGELMKAASDWISGERGCRVEEGEAQLKEMDRNGGWRSAVVEVEEMAADVEARVLEWLLDELVLDIVSC